MAGLSQCETREARGLLQDEASEAAVLPSGGPDCRVSSTTSAPPLPPRRGCSGPAGTVLPKSLVLDRRGGRPCGDHPLRHSDTAAEALAQASGAGGSTNRVGQRLSSQAEQCSSGVGVIRLNLPQGAGCGIGDGHCRRFRLLLALADVDAAYAVGPELDVVPFQGGGFRPSQAGVGHDSDDREVDGSPGLRHSGCPGATTAAASRKAGGLPDPGQGIGGERVGLIASALEDLGHGWLGGRLIALRYALGGMSVGDRGSGLRDGDDGLARGGQVAEVEGDCLGFCGH